jgi:DNA relaxase NicK
MNLSSKFLVFVIAQKFETSCKIEILLKYADYILNMYLYSTEFKNKYSRHHATSRKVAGSIPDKVIECFQFT